MSFASRTGEFASKSLQGGVYILGVLYDATAVKIALATPTLSVRSEPSAGVAIGGDKAGTTDYEATCSAREEIALAAPWRHGDLFFLRWEGGDGNLLSRRSALSLCMDSDKTVVAIYGNVSDFYVNDSIAEGGSAAGHNDNPGTSPDAPMASIQALLDRYPEIGAGCTVHVSQGAYWESTVLGVNHAGLTLAGAGADRTAIFGGGSSPCLRLDGFASGTITGFTIRNGGGEHGGGIYCHNSSPTIADNAISGNVAALGGGIYCSQSSPQIVNNTIAGNSAIENGGGLYCAGGALPTLANNTIVGNSAGTSGGGLYCQASSPSVTNNTISGNTASQGGGILCDETSSPTIANCIIWGNGDDLVGALATFSCIGGTSEAGGNISQDPQFASGLSGTWTGVAAFDAATGRTTLTDANASWFPGWYGTVLIRPDTSQPTLFVVASTAENRVTVWGDASAVAVGAAYHVYDFHLKSSAGRFDPFRALPPADPDAWVLDSVMSPAVDAGDPSSDSGQEPSPNGSRVNMGVYGGTREASKTSAAPVEVLMAVVSGPTASDRVTTLPSSEAWIDEWDQFYIEIWVRNPSGSNGVSVGSVDVRYDSDYFTAMSIDHGSVFTESPTGAIDDAAGLVDDVGGRTLLTNVGVNEYALLARIQMGPVDGAPRGDQVPVDEISKFWGPYDLGLSMEQGDVAFALVDVGTVAANFQPVPSTELWAVVYDMDDNNSIDFGDFSYFAPAFGLAVGGTEPPYLTWADFDKSGLVDFGDFSYFAPNFGKSRPDDISFPANYTQNTSSRSTGSVAKQIAAAAGEAGSQRSEVGGQESETESLVSSLQSPVSEHDGSYGVRVVSKDARGMTIEIVPPELSIGETEEGQELSMAGYSEDEDTGTPQRGYLVQIESPNRFRGEILETDSRETEGVQLRPPAKMVAVLDDGGLMRRGEVAPRISVRRVVREQRASTQGETFGQAGSLVRRHRPQPQKEQRAETEGCAPADVVEFEDAGWQRDSHYAMVKVRPVQYDAARQVLRHHTRLLLRIWYGDEPSLVETDEPTSEAKEIQARLARSEAVKIAVTRDGLCSVPLRDVGMAASEGLSLYHRGRPVPMQVRGDCIVFYGQANCSPYTHESVYWLTDDSRVAGRSPRDGIRMATKDAAPADSERAETTAVAQIRSEQDGVYWCGGGTDIGRARWLWQPLPVGETRNLPFDAPGARGRGRLRLRLHGTSEAERTVRIGLNSEPSDDIGWTGVGPRDIESDPGDLRVAGNVLALRNAGPGTVCLDFVELNYERTLTLTGGLLDFVAPEPCVYRVPVSMGASVSVYDVTNPEQPLTFTGVALATEGTVASASFKCEAGHRYIVAEEDVLSECTVGRDVRIWRNCASDLREPVTEADLLVVGPEALLRTIDPLMVARAQSGIRVLSASLEDVYDEFGHGEVSPDSIRAFVRHAYDHAIGAKPRWLMLLGEAACDYRVQHSQSAYVPTKLTADGLTETSSDSWYGCVRGRDNLPEVYVGRIPAATEEDAMSWVEQMLSADADHAGVELALSQMLLPLHLRPDADAGCAISTIVLPTSGRAVPLAQPTEPGGATGQWSWSVARETAQRQASLKTLLHVALLGDPSLMIPTAVNEAAPEEAEASASSKYDAIVELLDSSSTTTATADGDGVTQRTVTALSDYKLIAVFAAGEIRTAIVEDARGNQTPIRAGQTMDGWQVVEIQRKYVALTKSGESLRIAVR